MYHVLFCVQVHMKLLGETGSPISARAVHLEDAGPYFLYFYKNQQNSDRFYKMLTRFDIFSLLLDFTTYLESYNVTKTRIMV